MDKPNQDTLPEVVITKPSRFSVVWVVPIIALAVAGWLTYANYAKRGPTIHITFQDGSGLVAGKTEIQYLGVKVGTVEKVHLDEKLSQVVVSVRMDKSAAGLATQGAAFWVVRPQIGLGGIHGLDTLISGPYIGVFPGNGSTAVAEYTGLPEAPPASPKQPGLNLILQADKLASLTDGDPVYYREFQVGEIDQVYLASDAQSVHAHIHIKEEYAPLVRENTHFWNASGIGMSLGLFGAKVSTESLASILAGGVSFATPPNDEMGDTVSSGTVFKLYDEPEDEWSEWSPTIPIKAPVVHATQQIAGNAAKPSNVQAVQATEADQDDATISDPAGTDESNSMNQKQTEKLMPAGPPAHHH